MTPAIQLKWIVQFNKEEAISKETLACLIDGYTKAHAGCCSKVILVLSCRGPRGYRKVGLDEKLPIQV